MKRFHEYIVLTRTVENGSDANDGDIYWLGQCAHIIFLSLVATCFVVGGCRASEEGNTWPIVHPMARPKAVPVSLDGRWGLASKSGDHIVKCIYSEIEYMSNEYAIAKDERGISIVDLSARDVLLLRNHSSVRHAGGEYFWKRSADGGAWVLFSMHKPTDVIFEMLGDEVIEPSRYGSVDGTYASFAMGGKMYLLSLSDDEFGMLGPYFYASESVDGTATVVMRDAGVDKRARKDNIAIIDRQGAVATRLDGISAYPASGGRIVVKAEDGWSVYSTESSLKIAGPYEWTMPMYSEKKLGVRRGEKWHFIDDMGQSVFEQEFDGLKRFNGKVAAVMQNGGWGVVDNSGRWVIKPEHEFAAGLFAERYILIPPDQGQVLLFAPSSGEKSRLSDTEFTCEN